MKQKRVSKIKTMWRVVGLEDSPKNDKTLYVSETQADMNAPVPSYIYPVEVVIIDKYNPQK